MSDTQTPKKRIQSSGGSRVKASGKTTIVATFDDADLPLISDAATATGAASRAAFMRIAVLEAARKALKNKAIK